LNFHRPYGLKRMPLPTKTSTHPLVDWVLIAVGSLLAAGLLAVVFVVLAH